MSEKLQRVNIVTFHSELRLRHEYSHWKDVLERNAYKESKFELV
jgi:hypothetical protein